MSCVENTFLLNVLKLGPAECNYRNFDRSIEIKQVMLSSV